jgi:hypothetical protein
VSASTEVEYAYELRVEIEPTDVGVLIDALEDEPFALRDLLGEEELVRRIRSRELVVEARSPERWEAFERDLEVLSIYLSQYIVGREVVLRPTRGAPIVKGWKVVARRGEVVRLDLDLLWDPRTEQILDHGEDLAAITERWHELPEWLRSALRVMHPRLRAL